MTWRRLPLATGPCEALLAEGARLLDGIDGGTPIVRWYRPSDAAIVVGRGQQTEWFAAADIGVVSRFSGGGAVLMDDGLLSLDVIVPSGHPLLDGDLAAPFLRIGAAWGRGLASLGVPAVVMHEGASTTPRRGTERERLLAAICYATLGRGEITSSGRKIVGLAQRRRRPGALIQCGLLRRWQPQPLLRALGAAGDDEQILNAAAGIDEFLPDPPSDAAVMAAVEESLNGVLAAS